MMNHFSGFSMKILVRNLDRLVTDAEVLDLFKAYGKVDSCVVVKPGKILFELDGVSAEIAEEAFKLADAKLPIKTKFVKRIG